MQRVRSACQEDRRLCCPERTARKKLHYSYSKGVPPTSLHPYRGELSASQLLAFEMKGRVREEGKETRGG